MSVLKRIAFYQGRRDEVPNQQLAVELARTRNSKGITEIAQNLGNKDRNVQSDCLKVLYEIGYLQPELIADYVEQFLNQLQSKNNRMVWGSMIALGTISAIRPKQIWHRIDEVIEAVNTGSLITVVWGVKTLAGVASTNRKYKERLFPILLTQIRICLPRDVPMHAESSLVAVDERNKALFLSVLEFAEDRSHSFPVGPFAESHPSAGVSIGRVRRRGRLAVRSARQDHGEAGMGFRTAGLGE